MASRGFLCVWRGRGGGEGPYLPPGGRAARGGRGGGCGAGGGGGGGGGVRGGGGGGGGGGEVPYLLPGERAQGSLRNSASQTLRTPSAEDPY